MKPGDVLTLTEDDYKYGTGPLTIRVDEVLGEAHLHDGCWMQLRGRAIWNGKIAEKRFLYVKLKDHP